MDEPTFGAIAHHCFSRFTRLMGLTQARTNSVPELVLELLQEIAVFNDPVGSLELYEERIHTYLSRYTTSDIELMSSSLDGSISTRQLIPILKVCFPKLQQIPTVTFITITPVQTDAFWNGTHTWPDDPLQNDDFLEQIHISSLHVCSKETYDPKLPDLVPSKETDNNSRMHNLICALSTFDPKMLLLLTDGVKVGSAARHDDLGSLLLRKTYVYPFLALTPPYMWKTSEVESPSPHRIVCAEDIDKLSHEALQLELMRSPKYPTNAEKDVDVDVSEFYATYIVGENPMSPSELHAWTRSACGQPFDRLPLSTLAYDLRVIYKQLNIAEDTSTPSWCYRLLSQYPEHGNASNPAAMPFTRLVLATALIRLHALNRGYSIEKRGCVNEVTSFLPRSLSLSLSLSLSRSLALSLSLSPSLSLARSTTPTRPNPCDAIISRRYHGGRTD
jgi:hypothetical protein